jgi:YfiH family protein
MRQRKIAVLRADNLAQAWLLHGFSTRHGGASTAYGGGALNLGFTKDDCRTAVQSNREAFVRALGGNRDGKLWPLVWLRQVHSDLIHLVDGPTSEPPAGDGLITRTPGLLLAVKTADCLPVLLVDGKRRAIAALHAGWRGTVKRMVEKAVGEMRRRFGSQAKDLLAAIGPGIHACCYEVGQEVREEFRSQFAYADELFAHHYSSDPVHDRYPLLFLNMRAPGHGEAPRTLRLDLVEANRRQLREAGVEKVWASPLCTSCRTDLLFSHRAEKGGTGRMMAVIGIKP